MWDTTSKTALALMAALFGAPLAVAVGTGWLSGTRRAQNALTVLNPDIRETLRKIQYVDRLSRQLSQSQAARAMSKDQDREDRDKRKALDILA